MVCHSVYVIGGLTPLILEEMLSISIERTLRDRRSFDVLLLLVKEHAVILLLSHTASAIAHIQFFSLKYNREDEAYRNISLNNWNRNVK